ncbi:2-oxoglutarate dehydrogenase E1 component [Paenibacillus wulumuqiensis]|uniref:2-oxoglutarate dehydrogenase E1 component n=1 Tax=Paenibacillus wulumuqiensis TaxID=1567107 RepID=UPI000619FCF2|nr:2-oxoglutarate dehydrogenase E1 component [Paenibacillus wulumuqiensis]
MTIDESNRPSLWQSYYGPNLGYVQEQYEKYKQDPNSVDEGYRTLFEQHGEPVAPAAAFSGQAADNGTSTPGKVDTNLLKKAVAAERLVWNIRTYGHLAADIDPLGLSTPSDVRLLDPQEYGLGQRDLAQLPASLIWENAPEEARDGWEAIQILRQKYTGPIAYEFSHVHDEKERNWLNRQVETNSSTQPLSDEEKLQLLHRLVEVEQFEEFLHKTFVGQKRFSIEGNDALVPMLDTIVRIAARGGARHVLMGMAHRGRLNVLAHVLNKPYGKIFSEFQHSPNKDMMPSEGSMGINFGWTGDVKYHLGARYSMTEEGQSFETRLTLANNPSHLEYVNPVVEGFTRAAQDDRSEKGYPRQDKDKAAAIIMHGDAAFAGEGIVAETLNFNQLPGFQNGGTIHIIVNNRLGFTTDSKDSRSTHYASDLAKGYEIPVVHVNADDPEACLRAAEMAMQYRNLFKKDFLIDLIGYRRYGHNEADDPETTQPLMYGKVKNHMRVASLYGKKLAERGVADSQQYEKYRNEVQDSLKAIYDQVKNDDSQQTFGPMNPAGEGAAKASTQTAVPADLLSKINQGLLTWPDNFSVYPKLQRILERRTNALAPDGKVDWGHAETLAFATILAEGKPIRITGQDAERATFAHRNLVLHDAKTGEEFCPLHRLPEAKASFAVHNSPLSEAAVIGFEYGYNVHAPETLVIWEAQYGDFVNAGQVLIDQFISAGRSKWTQKSSLVMLLPHGYEGMGPEHSSARPERFLQLAGEDNFTVANLTSASQYFHLLRRQALSTETEEARPLVVMAPKSLIRNPRVASAAAELSEGSFKPVIEQKGLGDKKAAVERVILCTGKVAIDLEEALDKEKDTDFSWLHIIRVEQLYPFPKEEITKILSGFTNLQEIIWVQEEPKNMGYWTYMDSRLREVAPEGSSVSYIGRPERSSPASGYQHIHAIEQQRIMTSALKPNSLKNISLGR